MARIVKTQTINDMKCKTIIDDGKVDTIEQVIVRVFPNQVQVVSQNNKTYMVNLSDKVRMTMTPRPDDIAVIKTFKDGWLVVDLIQIDRKPIDESAVVKLVDKLERRRNRYELYGATQEEWDKLDHDQEVAEKEETEKQLRDFKSLLGGY